MEAHDLRDRVTGALLGAAIGDALGGPVEDKRYWEIETLFGRVTDLLPYSGMLWAFYAWQQAPGTVTDDTRMRHLLVRAILADGATLRRQHLQEVILERWQGTGNLMEKEWLEEYALSAQRDRLFVGGHPGNAGLISSLPIALVHPGEAEAAYRTAFEALYFDQGYARDCSATYCALAALALTTTDSLAEVVAAGMHAAPDELAHSRHFERPVMVRFEQLQAILEAYPQFEEYKHHFYAELAQPVTYDALETLMFALGVVLADPDDPERALLNAVNLGRDNDSTATLVGGLMGGRFGCAAWRPQWIATVVQANPEIDFYGDAERLADIALRRLARA